MKKRRFQKSFAVLAAASVIVAACGGDDDDDAAEPPAEDTASEPADEPADEPSDEPADEPAEEPAEIDADDDGVTDAGAVAEGDVDTGVEEATDVAQTGGEIVVGLEAEAVGMRPWEDACASSCYNIMATVFDKLTELTADGTYEGWLLESISPNEDFTVWSGTLRPGISFTNGVPLTAQTIVDMFAIQQEGSQSQAQISASTLSNVEATGELDVQWTLDRSNSAFPAYLSRAQLGFVFEPAAAAADLDGAIDSPVGTGPFILEKRDLDNETVVVRNPDYWLQDADGVQLPYLDKVTFRPIPDEGTRLDSVVSGTTNVAHTLRQSTIRDGRASRDDDGQDIRMYEFQGNNVGGGYFNAIVPPFDDVRVRKGLIKMISQENLIEALGGTGISLGGTQWFSPDSPWYSEAAAATYNHFDFEAGRALVQEYVDDPERSDGEAPGTKLAFELSCPPDPSLLAWLAVIEQTWNASELVELDITNYDQQTHINYALGAENGFVGEHGAHCWRFADDNDPSTSLNTGFAPPTAEIAAENGLDGIVSPLNFANYFDLEVFGNLTAALATDNFEERYAIYESVMIHINENAVMWYSGHTATALITSGNVEGLNTWQLPDGSLGAGHPNAEGHWAYAWLS